MTPVMNLQEQYIHPIQKKELDSSRKNVVIFLDTNFANIRWLKNIKISSDLILSSRVYLN
jgi:hypothetical protein